MTNLLKFELNRLWYSYALFYAIPLCIFAACITQFVVAGNPQSPAVFGMSFEFFIPHLLIVTVPTVYVAKGQQKGIVRTSLLSGQNRYKIFVSKALVYFSAIFIVLIFYIILVSLMNAKGMQLQKIADENSFVYFLKCASIGFSYCFMLSSLLFLIAIAFGNAIICLLADLVLFLIDFIMKSTLDWRVSDKIVPSAIMEAIMNDSTDKTIIIHFTLMVIITFFIALFISMVVFRYRNYK